MLVLPDPTHAAAFWTRWNGMTSLVCLGPWVQWLECLKEMGLSLHWLSYPGLLSIVVSGPNPKRTRVGAARSLETCLEVIHNLCYVLLAKANQKASPDSRGRELDSISW